MRIARTTLAAVAALAGTVLAFATIPAFGDTAASSRKVPRVPALHCGDVVTADVHLTADLVDCPGAGLVVGADNILIDLGGHTISGSHSSDAGIDDFAGHDGITIIHGAVRSFATGVAFVGTRGTRVAGVTVTTIDFAGVLLVDATDNQIQDNQLSDVGSGVFLFRSSRTRIKRNEITDTSGAGIEVDGASADNEIARNRIVRTFDVGIVVAVFDDDPNAPPEFPTGNKVADNQLRANSFGILLVEANGGAITRNTVTDAGSFGDPGAPGGGIGLDGGDHNLLARNLVVGSRGNGIEVGADPQNDPHPFPPTGNRLLANTTSDGGADGLHIAAIAQQTFLKRNVAERNAEFGILAISPVLDGGGNAASGNGAPTQCSGIPCAATG
jgi:parallel beta-helix repeat protein